MNIEATIPETLPVVLFGLDDKGKGHASRFEPTEAALAEKAAALMGLQVLRLATPDELALAADLPAGKVFASGKAFVPFVARARFDRLAAAPAAFTPEPPADGPAPAPAKPVGKRKAAAAALAAQAQETGPERPGTPPADWPGLQVGSLALAAEEDRPEIWYAATIVAQRGDDLFELKWLEDEGGAWPLFVRRREHLGLFPPALADTFA